MDTVLPSAKRPFVLHSRALNLQHAELETFAAQQHQAFLGTAGSVITRSNEKGYAFYVHKFLDGDRKTREVYLGPTGSDEAETLAETTREKITEVKELTPSLRLLGREGFNLVDAKTYGALASLHNHGVFHAGGMLIGSHAYGLLLNRLGVRATPYATEDIDIARREALAFKKRPTKGLLQILNDSGVQFVEVPSLNRKQPSTSFKQKGKSRFSVDLLVPSKDESFPTIAVPELKAHAKGLPYLKYLLAESQPATLLAREGCCEVRIPLPERFALHKMVVSQLRSGRGPKSAKDIDQAIVLCAALAELHPGAISDAFEALSRKMKKHFQKAMKKTETRLRESAPLALTELGGE